MANDSLAKGMTLEELKQMLNDAVNKKVKMDGKLQSLIAKINEVCYCDL